MNRVPIVVDGFGNVAAAFVATKWPQEWHGLSYASRLLLSRLRAQWAPLGHRASQASAWPAVTISTVGRRGQSYQRLLATADRLGIPRPLLSIVSLINTLEGASYGERHAMNGQALDLTTLTIDVSCVDSERVLEVLHFYRSLRRIAFTPYGDAGARRRFIELVRASDIRHGAITTGSQRAAAG